MIKSFRGITDSSTTVTIRLSTNNGLIGYRIKKFQVMAKEPHQNYEILGTIFTTDPGAVSANANLGNPLVIGVSFNGLADGKYAGDKTVIMDHVVVNQDLFCTFIDSGGGTQEINYYIELEQVKLSKDEAAVATLKDMRGRE